MNGSLHYRAPSRQRIQTSSWGPETVVYNPVSGDTHLLESPGSDLLERILQSPATHQELKQWFGKTVDSTEKDLEEELEDYLAFTLEQFVQLGLIETAPDKSSS